VLDGRQRPRALPIFSAAAWVGPALHLNARRPPARRAGAGVLRTFRVEISWVIRRGSGLFFRNRRGLDALVVGHDTAQKSLKVSNSSLSGPQGNRAEDLERDLEGGAMS
jgi:hypothetical protein